MGWFPIIVSTKKSPKGHRGHTEPHWFNSDPNNTDAENSVEDIQQSLDLQLKSFYSTSLPLARTRWV